MQCYFTALRNYGDNAAGVEGARPGEDKRVMERTHIALGWQRRSFAARHRWTVAVPDVCFQ